MTTTTIREGLDEQLVIDCADTASALVKALRGSTDGELLTSIRSHIRASQALLGTVEAALDDALEGRTRFEVIDGSKQ